MKHRQLGARGPRVSAIGLGRGSQAVKPGDPLESEFNETIRRAIDVGITLFDSSDLYWNTRHEVLLGRAIQGRRHKVLITTKFGNIDLPDGKKGTNGKPDYVRQACEASGTPCHLSGGFVCAPNSVTQTRILRPGNALLRAE